MAGPNQYGDHIWDRLFDLITPDVEQMSSSEVNAELRRVGIDTTAAFQRVTDAIEAQRGREKLAQARAARPSMIARLASMTFQHFEDARTVLESLIASRVPAAQRPVYHNRLEKIATESDLQSLLHDLELLDHLEAEESDG